MKEQLQAINEGFNCSPFAINNGQCEDWANIVMDRFPNVEIWETLFGISDTNHVFVKVNGKFYDAECLDGVLDHMELPIFAKLAAQIAKRQPVWLIDHNYPEEVGAPPEHQRDVTEAILKEYESLNIPY